MASKTEIEQEVTNLKIVKQFIGWGRMIKSDGEEVDYILMPHMGDPRSKVTSLSEPEKLNTDATARYKKMYHLAQRQERCRPVGASRLQLIVGIRTLEILCIEKLGMTNMKLK
jgi:hypothetical protein